MGLSAAPNRIDWVDHAKGICIILVVLMHATLGVEKAAGEVSWLNGFITWAKPFRMPDFFLISGLFLSQRIDRPWRGYLDGKILHFAYFYVLWMTIQFAFKGPGHYHEQGFAGVLQSYAVGFAEPFGTLWFIYLLAVFFAVTKLLRPVPPLAVLIAAAILQMAQIHTGSLLIDEFAARFVYFFTGYWLAGHVFAFAAAVNARSLCAIAAGLFIWAALNTLFVARGWPDLPGLGLFLGFIGACAVVSMAVLLAKSKLAEPIRYCGANSIIIYLAFFLFMAGSRAVLLKFAPGLDLGVISLIVTAAGILGPVLLYWTVRRTPLSFLFRRPQWAMLASRHARWHSAAHVKFAPPEAR